MFIIKIWYSVFFFFNIYMDLNTFIDLQCIVFNDVKYMCNTI